MGEGGLGTVVCELDSEGPAGWQVQDVSCSWRSGITAAAVLEPPVRLRKVVERVDGEVGRPIIAILYSSSSCSRITAHS